MGFDGQQLEGVFQHGLLRQQAGGTAATARAPQSPTEHTDPLIRMAELYLNYAEAANEASGPARHGPEVCR